MLFVAATHLNEVPLSAFKAGDDIDLMDIANLNLTVGTKAVKLCAFPSACDYFGRGIQAMELQVTASSTGLTSWQLYYGTAYKLYSSSAHARHVVGDYEVCREHSQIVLSNAKTFVEKLPVYKSMECSLSRQGKHSDATNLIVTVVKLLGIFPERLMKATMLLDFIKMNILLRRHSDDQILALPVVEDPIQLTAMDFLSRLARRAALSGNFQAFVVASMRALIYTFEYGLCGDSAVAMANCGRIYCHVMGDNATGHRLGRLAIKAIESFNAEDKGAWVKLLDGFFITASSSPLTECLKSLQSGFREAVETGEAEGAGWSGYC